MNTHNYLQTSGSSAISIACDSIASESLCLMYIFMAILYPNLLHTALVRLLITSRNLYANVMRLDHYGINRIIHIILSYSFSCNLVIPIISPYFLPFVSCINIFSNYLIFHSLGICKVMHFSCLFDQLRLYVS